MCFSCVTCKNSQLAKCLYSNKSISILKEVNLHSRKKVSCFIWGLHLWEIVTVEEHAVKISKVYSSFVVLQISWGLKTNPSRCRIKLLGFESDLWHLHRFYWELLLGCMITYLLMTSFCIHFFMYSPVVWHPPCYAKNSSCPSPHKKSSHKSHNFISF